MAVAVAEMTLASIDSNKLLHISVSFKLNNKILLWYPIGLNKRNIQTRSTTERIGCDQSYGENNDSITAKVEFIRYFTIFQ